MEKILICEKWNKTLKRKYFDAENCRKNDEFCDVTLQSVDNVQVKAHRIVLTIGSNYFKNLFSSGMQESSSDCIKYRQIKGDTLESVVSFMYTGQIKITSLEKLEEIAVCANYFQLEELIEECSSTLLGFINNDNCVRYWRLAQELFQKDFQNGCISYILTLLNEIYKNEAYINQFDQDEIEILLKDTRLRWSEEEKFKNILNWCKNHSNNSADEFSHVFIKLLDLIDFSIISDNFMLTSILEYDDLQQKDIRNKIAECRKQAKNNNKSSLSNSNTAAPQSNMNVSRINSRKHQISIICPLSKPVPIINKYRNFTTEN